MNRTRLAVLCALVLLLPPSWGRAWNYTGHMTVALIAWRDLDDAERTQVAEILRSHPHYQRLLLSDRPERVGADEWAFLRCAVWPDLVRPAAPGTGQPFKGPEITRFHHGGWHVYPLRWVKPADRTAIDPATQPAPEEPHLLTALPEQTNTLASRDAAAPDRAVALAWIAHLTGDLHQPLHACWAVSRLHPDGDLNGSMRLVRADGGEVIDLHRFWDRQMGTSHAYAAFDFLARSVTADPRHAPDALARLSLGDTPADWAQESHALAIAFVHLDGRLETMSSAHFAKARPPADEVPAMPTSYAANARAVAEQRIAQAGHRLAATIKAALATSREGRTAKERAKREVRD